MSDKFPGSWNDTTGSVAGEIEHAATQIVDQPAWAAIGGSSSSLANLATEVGEDAASMVQDVAKKAGDLTLGAGETVKARGRGASASLSQAIEVRPMAAVVVAAAVGYGIAYLIHRR